MKRNCTNRCKEYGYFVAYAKLFFTFGCTFFGKENGDVPKPAGRSDILCSSFSSFLRFDRIYPKNTSTCIKAINSAEHTTVHLLV